MRQLRRVVVSGMGAVTPAGSGVQTTWNALFGPKGFVRNTTKEDDFEIELLGKATLGLLAKDFPTEYWSTRLDERNGSIAPLVCSATEALDDAGWKPSTVEDQERCGITLSTTEMKSRHVLDNLRSIGKPILSLSSRSTFLKTHEGFICGEIAKAFNFRGPARIFASACASGQIAIGYAFRMIQEGEADVVLATSGVASPETFTLASMIKLGATTSSVEDPESACRPFDESRLGAVVSQGGGAIVLEELSHALRRKAKIHCEVQGFSAISEGEHPVRPQNEGAGFALSMKRAVEEAGLTAGDIGHVRTHSTGTIVGDLCEAISIDKYFGVHKPVISTSKGHIGHSGQAAGIVESAIAILCIKNGIVPPILNLKRPLALPEGKTLNFAQEAVRGPIKAAIVNGTGFGGICASVVYTKYEEKAVD